MSFSELYIGNQVWMSENSEIITFRNGDIIPFIDSPADWLEASNNKLPAYCDYPVIEGLKVNCGKLYNWYAINDLRGLVPEGWRIPTFKDFKDLKNNIHGNSENFIKNIDNCRKISSNEPNIFSLLGGTRDFKGDFLNFGEFGFWWTSDEYKINSLYAYGFDINLENNSFFSFFTDKGDGLSVRLMRNI